MGLGKNELSVSLVDDDEIAELNEQYLNRKGPTNVISFPQGDGPDPGRLLGDVVVSVETAERNAAEEGLPRYRVVDHFMVHGILHLAGYDHEGTDEQTAAEMERMQQIIMKALKKPETTGSGR